MRHRRTHHPPRPLPAPPRRRRTPSSSPAAACCSRAAARSSAGDRLLLIAKSWTSVNGPVAVVTVQDLVTEKDPHGRTNTRVVLERYRRPAGRRGRRRLPAGPGHARRTPVQPAGQRHRDHRQRTRPRLSRPLSRGGRAAARRDAGRRGSACSYGTGFVIARLTQYAEKIWYANARLEHRPPPRPAHDGIAIVGGRPDRRRAERLEPRRPTAGATRGDRSRRLDRRRHAARHPVATLTALPRDAHPRPSARGGSRRRHHCARRGRERRTARPSPPTPAVSSSDVTVDRRRAPFPPLQAPLRDPVGSDRGHPRPDRARRDARHRRRDRKPDRTSRCRSRRSPTSPTRPDAPATATPRRSSSPWTAGTGPRCRCSTVTAPDEPVFETYEDDAGKTHVRTGDGQTGRRLPSGAKVVATYRVGSGAAVPARRAPCPRCSPRCRTCARCATRSPRRRGGPATRRRASARSRRGRCSRSGAPSAATTTPRSPPPRRASPAPRPPGSGTPTEQRPHRAGLRRRRRRRGDLGASGARRAGRPQPARSWSRRGRARSPSAASRCVLDPSYVAAAACSRGAPRRWSTDCSPRAFWRSASRCTAAASKRSSRAFPACSPPTRADALVWTSRLLVRRFWSAGPAFDPGAGGFFTLSADDLALSDEEAEPMTEPTGARPLRSSATPTSCGPCSRRSTAPPTARPSTATGRCTSCSTASARRWRSCGAASTGSGRTSRSRPATAGSSPTSPSCWPPTSCPAWTPRGQRLDVANTIYYRRRKGTVALLEQLGPRRHRLRDAGDRVLPAALAQPAQPRPGDRPPGRRRRPGRRAHPAARSNSSPACSTGTPAGGSADLRNPLGAALTGTAYDEYHHRLDVRLGRGALGWYGIPKIGFFLWRTVALARRPRDPGAASRAARATSRSTRPAGRSRCSPRPRAAATTTARAGCRSACGSCRCRSPTPLWEAVTAEQLPDPGPPTPTRTRSLWRPSLSVSATGSGDPLEPGAGQRVARGRPVRDAGRRARRASRSATTTGCSRRIGAGPVRPPRRPASRPPVDPAAGDPDRRRLGDHPAERDRRAGRHRHDAWSPTGSPAPRSRRSGRPRRPSAR